MEDENDDVDDLLVSVVWVVIVVCKGKVFGDLCHAWSMSGEGKVVGDRNV